MGFAAVLQCNLFESQLFSMSTFENIGSIVRSTPLLDCIRWLCSFPSDDNFRHGLWQAAGRFKKGPHLFEALLEKLLCRLVGGPASQPEGSRLPTAGVCSGILMCRDLVRSFKNKVFIRLRT